MNSIHRMKDANLNRLSEALRVLEDICRFVLDDGDLNQKLKQDRHHLIGWNSSLLLSHRNSRADVGTKINTTQEFNRGDLLDIAKANLKRTQEALRALEEISKTLSHQEACFFKNARYEYYEIEKQILLKLVPFCKPRLPTPLLYLVLTPETCLNRNPLLIAKESLEGGVKAIQIRSKTLSDKEIFDLAKKVKVLCLRHKALLIINDRIDIALAIDAHGVHLGQGDLPLCSAKKILKQKQIVGLSCHNLEQLQSKAAQHADYLAIGPIFQTQTKKTEHSPLGTNLLGKASSTSKPLVAIGGVNTQNINQIVAKGCQRVAIIAAITQANDVLNQTKSLFNKLKETKL